jgi:hypothetical protein
LGVLAALKAFPCPFANFIKSIFWGKCPKFYTDRVKINPPLESADFRGSFENEIRVFAKGFLSMLSYDDYTEEA